MGTNSLRSWWPLTRLSSVELIRWFYSLPQYQHQVFILQKCEITDVIVSFSFFFFSLQSHLWKHRQHETMQQTDWWERIILILGVFLFWGPLDSKPTYQKENKDETGSVLSDTDGVQLCNFNIWAQSEGTDDWWYSARRSFSNTLWYCLQRPRPRCSAWIHKVCQVKSKTGLHKA